MVYNNDGIKEKMKVFFFVLCLITEKFVSAIDNKSFVSRMLRSYRTYTAIQNKTQHGSLDCIEQIDNMR